MTDYHVMVYETTPADHDMAMTGRWVQRNVGGTVNTAAASILHEVPHWEHLQPLIVFPVYFH